MQVISIIKKSIADKRIIDKKNEVKRQITAIS